MQTQADQFQLAAALYHGGRVKDAAQILEDLTRVAPESPDAHVNFGMALLSLGEFERAWEHFDWWPRWSGAKDFADPLPQPLYTGQPIAGKSILLHGHQGLGDAIQFIRYAPLLAARGARVTVQCQRELHRLFQTVKGVDGLIASSETAPPTDVHCPMIALPWAFRTTLRTIPGAVPYVHASPRKISSEGFNIGLVWHGNLNQRGGEGRPLPPALLKEITSVPRASFHSLQKSSPPPAELNLIDHAAELHDMADTASLIMSLDLVISVDTSVAHLAGALGKPVWTLLSFEGNWRWMIDREDSPWYPTMKLIRQRAPGDWAEVIARVAGELSQYTVRG